MTAEAELATSGAPGGPAPATAAGRRAVPGGQAASRITLWALGLLCTVLVTAGFGLGVYLPDLHDGLIAAAFTAVGIFVVSRTPPGTGGHREGWLFVATGLAHALMFFCRQYGLAAGHDHPGLPAARWVMWAGVWPLPLVLVLIGVTLMCFPDGRLPSQRWRFVLVAMVVAGAALAAGAALWPVEYADDGLPLPHPLHLGGYATAQRVWDVAGPAAYLLFQLAWVACVVIRIRRADGDEGRQLRWFVSAVALGAAAMVTGLVAFGSPTLGVLSVPVIPVAAGVAIVKYRLYDIDPVINKTLVVGAMAGIVTTGYVAVVAGFGRLAGIEPGSAPALPLLATALVAVVFEPARRRVQRLADRLVYGERPSYDEALEQISVQAAELRAAAKRIVAAQYEARRRIERDLHDGAQQRLVTLALSLQSVAARAEASGDEQLGREVGRARAQLVEALSELREMARGIHPAILSQDGLEAALGFLAERSPLPVRVDVELGRRLPEDVEATAYFVVSEALTNAAKHAVASSVSVRGGIRDGLLQIEVTDDGRGGAGLVEAADVAEAAGGVADAGAADGHQGSGLQGLTDRLATLGGRLSVHSPPGGGTRLRAEIPCG